MVAKILTRPVEVQGAEDFVPLHRTSLGYAEFVFENTKMEALPQTELKSEHHCLVCVGRWGR